MGYGRREIRLTLAQKTIAQGGEGGASCPGWVERCLVITKAGRCVVNSAPATPAAPRGARSTLLVDQLCKLLGQYWDLG